MKVRELAELIGGTIRTNGGHDNEVTSGYICDLLSWVMVRGKPGCAWCTVQTHMNVIAVASLHGMACVIHPEGIRPEEAPVKKADEEGIAVITTDLTAYAVGGIMAANGIPSAGD